MPLRFDCELWSKPSCHVIRQPSADLKLARGRKHRGSSVDVPLSLALAVPLSLALAVPLSLAELFLLRFPRTHGSCPYSSTPQMECDWRFCILAKTMLKR